jgi:hypothetical protein
MAVSKSPRRRTKKTPSQRLREVIARCAPHISMRQRQGRKNEPVFVYANRAASAIVAEITSTPKWAGFALGPVGAKGTCRFLLGLASSRDCTSEAGAHGLRRFAASLSAPNAAGIALLRDMADAKEHRRTEVHESVHLFNWRFGPRRRKHLRVLYTHPASIQARNQLRRWGYETEDESTVVNELAGYIASDGWELLKIKMDAAHDWMALYFQLAIYERGAGILSAIPPLLGGAAAQVKDLPRNMRGADLADLVNAGIKEAQTVTRREPAQTHSRR